MAEVDETDLRILAALQKSGKIKMAELAEQVNMSISPCHRRIKRMEEEGIIQGYKVMLDRKKLGYALEIFLEVKFDGHGAEQTKKFKTMIETVPQIVSCRMISGEADYLLQLLVRDIEEYQEIVRNVLLKLPKMKDIRSSIVLENVLDNGPLPLS